MDILIKHARVLTPGIAVGEYDIGIENGKIVYFDTTAPADAARRTIDATGMVAMPGLINMHTHSPMVLMRGYAEGLPLMRWLTEMIFPAEDKLTDEDMYWASQLAMMEMLSTGTTCFQDMYFGTAGTLKAVAESGIRATLTHCATGVGDPAHKALERTRQLHAQCRGNFDGRVTVSVAPHAIYTCDGALLRQSADLAQELGVPLHIHLSETVGENEDCLAAHGMTPTAYLDSLGFFRPGVSTIAAHGVHFTDKDREILAKYGVTIASCPESNCKLGSGICELDKLLSAGINVTLGTDGASSNNNLNMIEELHLAALLLKGVRRDAGLLGAADMLPMVTANGAKALGLSDKIGTLLVGMEADIILMDLNRPHLQPVTDLASNLVYSAQGADVVLTMVQGHILYEKGNFTTIDKEQVYRRVADICRRVLKL